MEGIFIFLGALIFFVIALVIAVYVVNSLMLMKIFSAFGEETVTAWIPFLNMYSLASIANYGKKSETDGLLGKTLQIEIFNWYNAIDFIAVIVLSMLPIPFVNTIVTFITSQMFGTVVLRNLGNKIGLRFGDKELRFLAFFFIFGVYKIYRQVNIFVKNNNIEALNTLRNYKNTVM